MEFYDGRIFRPPSESRSLILQVTVGCSHNQCTFCYMYKEKKYRERAWKEIEEIIAHAAQQYPSETVQKIFLADGDALAMEHDKLMSLLTLLYHTFPYLQRVGIYAGPKSIIRKTSTELLELRKAGLSIAYLGLESGCPDILKQVRKGVTDEEMVEAGRQLKAAGIKLSLMVLGGLGGKDQSHQHAKASAAVVNQIGPDFLAVLTLRFYKGTPLAKQVEEGSFKPVEPMELIQELRWFVEDLELQGCIFRTNHASNRLILSGTLNENKDKILKQIDRVLKDKGGNALRPEHLLGL
ncbi:B12-binding domain-containing radical SAM protein [Metallumcola ferriviriculae]|uniref:B12-binding domain-containing radical SAM protein n=1 Tax=Metallumcola ferriviriculae TaxID=3039180 RepID=A0AAU0ULY7_9FIRM|nr:B12-binding domain-containing radical SAM protein [Desulfitibacteraceae bacterium MK1]